MADSIDDDAIPIVRIPADVDQPDKVVAGLTARQAAVLGTVTVALWLGYQACQCAVPPTVYLAFAVLALLATAGVVTMSRDGVPLDRLLAAWLRFTRTPKRQVLAPEGLPQVPAKLFRERGPRVSEYASPVHEVTDAGVLDLGPDGVTALAECTTVNLSLRSQREQAVILAGFARWLNSLTGSVAITVRTRPTDLSAFSDSIRDQAAGHPNESVRCAAREHVAFLADLATDGHLLNREVALAVHERSKNAASRLHRRIEDADALLGSAGVSAVCLSEAATLSLLNEAFNPVAPLATTLEA
ncbi:PrgI family protein [Catenulispora sp. NL8]|uniref:PrgI family protein n=1 Tax=Catenulispora pinistramenti TaxID=2705254 RepID=A0ABS5KGE2_9ACTN|nr:PrgI family protein [Catenulispora pinistramenti]MBS2545337.1 PrgI family protein [Catenulispora pinistramenti]